MTASASPPGEQAFEASPRGSASDRAAPGGEATVIFFFGWRVDRATLDRNPSSSRWTCSERAKLFAEVLCCCLSCSRVTSLTAPCRGPLLNFGLKGAQALLNAFTEIFHLFKQSGLELHAGAFVPFFHNAKHAPGEAGHFGDTTGLRVNDPPLFPTLGTAAQRNFCLSGPFLPFWEPIGSVPSRWVSMAPSTK